MTGINNNAEQLIAWLLDHSNLEVPDPPSTSTQDTGGSAPPPLPPVAVEEGDDDDDDEDDDDDDDDDSDEDCGDIDNIGASAFGMSMCPCACLL